MANVPADLRYTSDHEWARQDGDLIVVGITDYAQGTLGDVVYVELGDVGDSVKEGKAFGVVESVKAASDLFAPLSGEIVEVNAALIEAPDTVNSDPYGAAWLIKIRPDDAGSWDNLLDATAYGQLLPE